MQHQRENCALVVELLRHMAFDRGEIAKAMRYFTPPPYRLSICATIDGVTIWEDSKATTAAASIAALRHVMAIASPCLWIVCGRQKGGNLEPFRPAIALASEIICFGDVSAAFRSEFPNVGVHYLSHKELLLGYMQNFINRHRGQRAAIVFSPGFTSFDFFENYEMRGNWFRKEVAHLIRAKHLEAAVK
jgi:UDP-N-acetylmuramoylalanine--D-glutamate ligase